MKHGIRITSDGVGYGTKIVDAVSGDDLSPYIKKCVVSMDAGKVNEAVITTIGDGVDIFVDGKYIYEASE